MPNSVAERVRKRRESLRAAGLRPVQIWLPDTRRPGFSEECQRQATITRDADRGDADLLDFLDEVAKDVDELME